MKGFTLIELLAVIVLMSLLVLLAFSSISFLTKQREGDIEEVKLKTFYNNVEVYMNEYPNVYSEKTNYRYCIPVTDFIANSKYKEKDFIEMYKISNVANYVIEIEFTNVSNYEVSLTETANCTSGVRNESLGLVKSFGGAGDDYIVDFERVDDQYVIVGRTNSTTGDFASVVSIEDDYDSFVAITDLNFNIVSLKMFGERGLERFEKVIVKDGYIYVLGWQNDLTSLGEASQPTLEPGQVRSGFVVKYDMSLNTVDYDEFNLTSSAYILKQNDGFVFATTFQLTDGLALTNKGSRDILVAKINLNGTIAWTRTFGSTTGDNILSFISGNKDFYLSISPGIDDEDFAFISSFSSNNNMVVAKINADGTLGWLNDYSDSRGRINDMYFFNNALYISGYSNNLTGYSCTNACGLVFSIGSNGVLIDKKVISANSDVYFGELVVNKNKISVVANTAASNAIFSTINPLGSFKNFVLNTVDGLEWTLSEISVDAREWLLSSTSRGSFSIDFNFGTTPDQMNMKLFNNDEIVSSFSLTSSSFYSPKNFNFDDERIILFTSYDNTDDLVSLPGNGMDDTIVLRITW